MLLTPLLLLAVATASAQITLSTIRGSVTDPAGATVPDASVSVVQQETTLRRSVNANANGDFEISDLPRGTYRLTASAQGFKTFVADHVLLESNQVRRVNALLEIGAVTSEVTVRADAAVISTDSARITGTISGEKHPDMPWVGAEATLDPSLFLTTLPLIQQRGGVWGSHWAGQSTNQVQEGQDGHTNDGAVNQLNDIFDVQEINVVTVNNTAEFARVGYMNMVTKTGTNKFHGRALYWHQNSAFGAREFFEARKSKLLIHTMSGSMSGPIRKDKTFFYASANILKVPGKQFYLRTVPTARMRQGDFGQLLGGARPTIVRDPLAADRPPFANNVVPATRINAVSTKVNEKYLPAPNLGDANLLSRNYSFVFPFPTDYALREDFSQRIDHHVSQNNRLMGRAIWNWDLYVLPTNFPAFSWTRKRSNFHYVVEDTHVFSPTLVNSLRVGLYIERVRDGDTIYGVTPFKGDDAVKELGIQGVNPRNLSAQGFPRIDIAGYDTLRTQPGGYVQDDHNWGIADSVTWSRGRHVIKYGGEFKPQSRFTGNVAEGNYGVFNFNASLSGYGYSDFLLGLPFSSQRLDPLTNRTRRDSELGLYITDAWKVNNRLTLDLGLRWDRFGRPSFADGLVWRFDLDSGDLTVPSDARSKISRLYPQGAIRIRDGEVGPNPDRGNFAPRIGGAYRLMGDKAVIRAGYGIFNETLGRYARLLTGGPFELTETFQNTGATLFSFPNPFPATRGSVPSQSATGFPLRSANGYIHQFNVTVERQIRDLGFRASYVGSRNVGTNYNIGINKPQPGLLDFAQSRRPFPQFIGVTQARNDGKQTFNAFTFEVQRKVGQFTFDAHWTLASSYLNTVTLENPYAPLFWSRDPNTSRQRAVMNAVWQIPVGKGRHFLNAAPAAVDHVLGGWQLYWIGYFQTGNYFTPTFAGSDPSGTQTIGGRPDRVCNGNLAAGQRSVNRWFDTSCFAVPVRGRFGNSGDNVLEGPGYNMNHISIAKSVNFTERVQFTFTAAATNAFNHANFRVPAANISATDVGVVSNLVEGGRSRRLELRGRLEF